MGLDAKSLREGKGLKRIVKQVMLPMIYVPVITHRPIQSALCKSGQFNAKGHIWGKTGSQISFTCPHNQYIDIFWCLLILSQNSLKPSLPHLKRLWKSVSPFKKNYFWLCWVFVAAWTSLQVWRARTTLQWWWAAFSLWQLFSLRTGSRLTGFSSCGSRAPEHRLKSCRAQVQFLQVMQDLPRSGTEAVSPALAGGFFITEPPGKPWQVPFKRY